MKEIKFTKELAWKDHNVDLAAFGAWAKETLKDYCGASADVSYRLHFLEVPSDDDIAAIDLKWEELDDAKHEMCVSYKTKDQIEAEVLAKKESAKAKLLALGLSAEEVAALVG